MLPIGFNAPLLSIQCATGWPTLLYNIKKRLLKHCHARAERLTSSEVNYKEEINRVQLALKNNGNQPSLTTITNFEQHQENDSEPIFSGTTMLSWIIGKNCKDA